MRTCEEYEVLISALIDGALSEEDRAELVAHMAECPACQAYFNEIGRASCRERVCLYV